MADRLDRVGAEETTVNMENSESGNKDGRVAGYVCRSGTDAD
jgi:hypothetical protein